MTHTKLFLSSALVAMLASCGPKAKDTEDTDDTAVTEAELPLGIPTSAVGVVLAGASKLDMTPVITETFTDVNGNNDFDGCYDDPKAEREGCTEPFDDANGNGRFDAVFIGGYGPGRPANGVHDPVTGRAVVIEEGGRYEAMVVFDFVGLAHPRIEAARERLAAEGFDPERLLVMSTHNHQGPDTMGLWGDPLGGIPGFDEAYQQRVTDAIVTLVQDAIADMQEVKLKVGKVDMRDQGAYFNGSVFGGVNPTDTMHGMIHDIRDPLVVSDQVLVLQGVAERGTVFTLTSWSGHPEVRGSNNNDISADWLGYLHDEVEARYGGIALHFPECLGGMQSALGGDLPLVDADGENVTVSCTAEDIANAIEGCEGKEEGALRTYPDGLPYVVWAEHNTWDFARSHGFHIANAVDAALAKAEPTDAWPLRVVSSHTYVPVRNIAYEILGPKGIFDIGLDSGTRDPALCPQMEDAPSKLGCLPLLIQRIQFGELTLQTAPGELLPEMARGFPTEDARWAPEAANADARGAESAYFPQQPAACATVSMESCQSKTSLVEGCDCLKLHAWPYRLSDDPALKPALSYVDTKYAIITSMSQTYLSYIIPTPDVNHAVSLLSDNDGDHYEDTVTPSWEFGDVYLSAVADIAARWEAGEGLPGAQEPAE